MKRTRSIVIGAGILGSWIAYKLQTSGKEVILIDQYGGGNLLGSSHDQNRVIRGFYGGNETYTQMVSESFRDWKELESESNSKLYTHTGALWFIRDGIDESYPRNSIPISEKFGMNGYELSKSEASKQYPAVDFSGIQSVFFEEEAGYLNATQSCLSIQDLFIKKGGQFIREKITNWKNSSGSIESIIMKNGNSLSPDEVYLCCGPWINEWTQKILNASAVYVSRQEVLYFAHPLDYTKFDSSSLPVWVDFGEKIYYGIPGTEQTGFKLADDTRGRLFDPSNDDRNITEQSIHNARNFLKERFPSMGNQPMINAKVCQYSNTKDGNYIIDRFPELKNVYIVAGGNGHGFKNAPAIASIATKLSDSNFMPPDLFQFCPIENEGIPKDQVQSALSN